MNSNQNNGLNAPANQKGQAGEFTRAAGFLAYYEICDMVKNKGYEVVKDPEGRLGPYAHKDKQWVGYDDVAMIKYKSEYIRKMGFAGEKTLFRSVLTHFDSSILRWNGLGFGLGRFPKPMRRRSPPPHEHHQRSFRPQNDRRRKKGPK